MMGNDLFHTIAQLPVKQAKNSVSIDYPLGVGTPAQFPTDHNETGDRISGNALPRYSRVEYADIDEDSRLHTDAMDAVIKFIKKY